MNARLARVVPGSLCALLICAAAVHAADADDAKQAKSEAWTVKNGCDQWSGLFADHEDRAAWQQYYANYEYNLLVQSGQMSEIDRQTAGLRISLGDAEWDKSYGKRVSGDVKKAGATGHYQQGVTRMTRSEWDDAVGCFETAEAQFPPASLDYANGIEFADAARGHYEQARAVMAYYLY